MNRESRELYLRLLGYVRPHARVFALSVIPLHLAYYISNALAAAVGIAQHLVSRPAASKVAA